MKFSVVIPTFNRPSLTEQCVGITLKNAGVPRESIELIWVDDGSTNTDVRRIMRNFDPEIQIIKKHNDGTNKAKNAGYVLAATGDFVCLVDADMEASPDWLAKAVQCIQETDINLIAMSDVNRTRWQGQVVTKGAFRVREATCMVAGAFVAIRDVFDSIGVLDESFGYYGHADSEWTERARKAGFAPWYVEGIVATHRGGTGDASIREKKNKAMRAHSALYTSRMSNLAKYTNPYVPEHLVRLYNE